MSVESLAGGVAKGERRALARAITLIESTRADHQADAARLIEALMPKTGGALRVGISGSPGVGKSTFIEAFGLHVTSPAIGATLAVLAVDPSSSRTGGSILGDKTRMSELARHPNAFVRPSPSSGTLGGVARRTREVILLCEAAGFDLVLVETVGVGQSEVAVANLTDAFVLLVAPAAGDELQGVKRGIMELADLVVINKCDGDLERLARVTQADYTNALRLIRPRSSAWTPEVAIASSLTGRGVSDVWNRLGRYRKAMSDAGELTVRRGEQNRAWLWDEIREHVLDAFRRDPGVRAALTEMEADVVAGRQNPSAAADQLVARWRR